MGSVYHRIYLLNRYQYIITGRREQPVDQPYITAMKPTIEEILVEEGYISRQQLRRLRLFHKKCPERSVTELLTELGYADEPGF